MENASKALIMAGGILLSMIVISLFYFMFGNMSTLVGDTSKDTSQDEIVDFNKGYEAYNKKIMYGTDIISVFNKVTDNNRNFKATATNENQEYFIDVKITLTTDLEYREETYKVDPNNHRRFIIDSTKTKSNIAIRGGAEYSLYNNRDIINKFILEPAQWTTGDNDDIIIDLRTTSETKYAPDHKSYTVKTYPASEFKRKIFYCSGMKYSKTTGRVVEMSFNEK